MTGLLVRRLWIRGFFLVEEGGGEREEGDGEVRREVVV